MAAPKGSTFYRIGFSVLLLACLYNAYDAYTLGVQAKYGLLQGAQPELNINEAYAFLGLAFILMIECVGLIMYKWLARHLKGLL